TPIPAGAWVHTHNLTTNLGPSLSYHYDPRPDLPGPGTPTRTFRGFRRANGQVGVRNDLYIVPTVGCINSLCAAMAQQFEADHGG
ncbi:UxaA family hydrolase, partial [Klebsiella pneumoniae]|nr:UxaA family hydrolase [Klebsiella pneumoniae]